MIAKCLPVALMILAGAAIEQALPTRLAPSTPPGLEAHETHGSASLMGQFRTSVSSWLWLKTDLYLHNGVEMRPQTMAEKSRGEATQSHSEDDHAAIGHEENITTVIPSAQYDFRGLLGDIERACTTYQDMKGHRHNNPKTALPLFKLMTWIDPDFIPGWVTGASVMDTETALAYLERGRAANPDSIAVLAELGRYYATKKVSLRLAILHLDEALKIANQRANLDEEENDACRESYRWISLCYREQSQFAKMRFIASEGLRRYEDDPVLTRCAAMAPQMLTTEGTSLWYAGKPLTSKPIVR